MEGKVDMIKFWGGSNGRKSRNGGNSEKFVVIMEGKADVVKNLGSLWKEE